MDFKYNKRFKRDSQRVAFSLCVGFGGYGVMRKLGSGVVCPLTGRYATQGNLGVQSF
ncbi:DUF3265 domain-containing protein [Vibrio qinghaiensis]|uniref:DUF3265 domain-containing protein n=1 Tax=Vibrio qinghaiensis TaxID=2025808 RepID=A0A223N2W0_9VIBR|nr:DUF3265 domain-containing protein [Vibrio qinghaiensis]